MQLSTEPKIVTALILFQILAACAAPPSRYSDQATGKSLQSSKQSSTRVPTVIEEWRNSGIEV